MNEKMLNKILLETMEIYFRRYSNTHYMCAWTYDLEFELYGKVFGSMELDIFDNTDIQDDNREKIQAIAEKLDTWLFYGKEGCEPINLDSFKVKYDEWKKKRKPKRKKSNLAPANAPKPKKRKKKTAKKNPVKKVCVVCGNPLTGKARKYCSPDCQKKGGKK